MFRCQVRHTSLQLAILVLSLSPSRMAALAAHPVGQQHLAGGEAALMAGEIMSAGFTADGTDRRAEVIGRPLRGYFCRKQARKTDQYV